MSDDFISCDFPDLDAFIKELDLMDERVNAALRTALHGVGTMIEQAQRRCISGEKVGRKLAPHIRKGEIFTAKNGSLGISSGYQADAFRTDADGFNPGVVGMTYEFGRPGQSAYRRSETTTRTRNGKRYKVKKGAIQAVSHIRRGFDSVKNEAVNTAIAAYNAEIDKLGG